MEKTGDRHEGRSIRSIERCRSKHPIDQMVRDRLINDDLP